MNRYETQLRALRAAFPYTIPIFAGFWFLGLTYGIYMNVSGFSFLYPMLMSLTIFAGSVEFITVNLLLGAFNPFQALFLTLMVNARHLFYGLSMLDKFRGLGWKKVYLIFGMCDESFSINYTAQIPPDVDRGWFMFFVTLLNHFYWFSGSTLGGIFGGHHPGHAGHSGGPHSAAGDPGAKGGAGMTLTQQIITIAMVVLGTMITRFLPFLIFPAGKETPKYIQYVGKVLPAAVFGLLVVYCLRSVDLFSGSHGLPEAISIALVIALHVWKRQMLLSIAGGTVCYMLLVQLVF